MRYPSSHKEEVRFRIIEAASQAIRDQGTSGPGIPALMKRAGLTHGAFYSHFQNRDELVAEAVALAARETADRVFAGDLQTMLDAYLSRPHLDNSAHGCVLAALGTEAPRQPGPIRRAFSQAARGLIQLVEKKLHPKEPAEPAEPASDDTLVLASTMVGAVVLARLVDDMALADRILDAARQRCTQ